MLWIEPVLRRLHTAAVATGDGTIVDLEGKYAAAVVQIVGMTGVITFKGTLDGATWVNLPSINITTGVGGATAAANGIFSVGVLGLLKFKAEITTYTSGTINVYANIIPVSDVQVDVT